MVAAVAVLVGLLVGCGSDPDADAVEYEATELRHG